MYISVVIRVRIIDVFGAGMALCACREEKLHAIGRTMNVRRDGVYACLHPNDQVYIDARVHPKY